MSALSPFIKSASIRALAVAAPNRSPALPDVPTTSEAGLQQFQADAWHGLFAPRGTPPEALKVLRDALNRALDNEATKKRMETIGATPPTPAQRGSEHLQKLTTSEIEKWTPIIRQAGITGQ